MKKIIFEKFSKPSCLTLIESSHLALKPNEIKIKNTLAGVNPVDCKIREGSNLLSTKISLPFCPGFEAVGVVDSLGSNITDIAVGDRVAAIVGFPIEGGGYSEYSKSSIYSKIPEDVDDATAMLSLVNGITAYDALEFIADDSYPVLILGATGGVGIAMMNLLKTKNIKTFATFRSSESLKLIRSIGEVNPIKLQTLNLDDFIGNERVNIIDLVGGEVAISLISKLDKIINTFITVPTYSADNIKKVLNDKNIKNFHYILKAEDKKIKYTLESLRINRFKLSEYSLFDLKESAVAHEKYSSREYKFKILLKI